MEPAGYHFTNLLLHAANAVLVYWSTRRLLAAAQPAASPTALRAGAAVSYWAVAHHDYFTPATKYPLPSRVAMALYSMVFYVSKTVLPTDLSPLYELPVRINPLDPEFVGAAVAVALVSVSLVALAG